MMVRRSHSLHRCIRESRIPPCEHHVLVTARYVGSLRSWKRARIELSSGDVLMVIPKDNHLMFQINQLIATASEESRHRVVLQTV